MKPLIDILIKNETIMEFTKKELELINKALTHYVMDYKGTDKIASYNVEEMEVLDSKIRKERQKLD